MSDIDDFYMQKGCELLNEIEQLGAKPGSERDCWEQVVAQQQRHKATGRLERPARFVIERPKQ